MNKDKTTLGCVLALVTLMAIPFAYALDGYALTILWKWFVLAKFNLPIINVPEAIGLAIIIGYLTKQIQLRDKDKDKEPLERCCEALALMVLKPGLALLVGWIVKFWM